MPESQLTIRVLIVDDYALVANAMKRVLEQAGMQTTWAKNGHEALERKRDFKPHVVLIDLELPDTNGVALIKRFSLDGDCGLIVVSGHGEEADRVIGLELGADDFMAKPTLPRELVARVRAVHRRTAIRAPQPAPSSPSVPQDAGDWYAIGTLHVDVGRRLVRLADGGSIDLTAAEFAALEALIEVRGDIVSREQICERALRRPLHAEDRAVDQLIFSLRQKLGDEDKRLIRAVRGAGYVLGK